MHLPRTVQIVAGLGLAFALVRPLTAQSCTDASCFGPPFGATVTVGGTYNIAAGANLDFGPTHVVFLSSAVLLLEGSASITAAKITMHAGASIDGWPASQLFDVPHLSVTTTATGGFDGDASLLGFVNLGGANLGFNGWSGGNFVLNAAGDAHVAGLDASAGDAYAAGYVYVSGQDVTIGAITATATAGFFSVAASVTLVSYGDMHVGSIDTSFGAASSTSTINVVCSGDYVQTGSLSAVKVYATVGDTDSGAVSIVASGSATITGGLATGYAFGPLLGGACAVSAGGDLRFTGAITAKGAQGGGASLISVGGDVVFSGTIDVGADASYVSGGGFDEFGGFALLRAARDVDLSGSVTASNLHVPPYGWPSSVRIEAGRDAIVRAGATFGAFDAGSGGTGGLTDLLGCRVTVEPGAHVLASGTGSPFPTAITVVANDSVRHDGTMTAPAIALETRLGAPWGVVGTGSYSTPPVHTFDATRPPCLADFTTTFAANGPIVPGAVGTLTLTGPPSKSVLCLAALAPAAVDLGPFGYTQVAAPPGSLVLADDFGVFGPPIPASTDASGQWTFSSPTPALPSLAGLAIYADLYLFDPAARNGLFHQPRRAALWFQ